MSRKMLFPAILVASVLVNILFTPNSFSQSSNISKVFSVSENLNVDPTTGTATMSVPIEVAPGRAGIQPNITLMYNSSGSNGVLGVGWSLDLGSIAISPKKGIARYNGTETYVLAQSGSRQELVDVNADRTEFRFKNEGAFMKIKVNGLAGWTATDKKGTKYYFGQTGSSRIVDPNNSNRIYKWSLDRVEDVSGNYMEITYIKNWNDLYVREIRYTGNTAENLPAYANLWFTYDDTRLDVLRGFNAGYEVRTNWRLKSIDVKAYGNLLRSYTIDYTQDPQTRRSLVAKITQFGADGATPLPAVEFTYSQGNTNFYAPIILPKYPPYHIVNSGRVRIMDLNGDGLQDFLDSDGGVYKAYINQGNFTFVPPVRLPNAPAVDLNHAGVRIADISGDGLMDIIDGSQNPYKLWVNKADGTFDGPFTVTSCPPRVMNDDNLIQLVDMNGDGLTDILETFAYTGQDNNYKVYINNGQNDFEGSRSINPSPFRGANDPNLVILDFNGDNYPDVLWGEEVPYSLWVNNGQNGFDPRKYINHSPQHPLIMNNMVRLIDFNGDGLTDILESSGTLNPEYRIYLNNGNDDFAPAVVLNNPPPRGLDVGSVKLTDMNADGLADIVYGQYSAGTPYQVWFNNGFDGFTGPATMANSPNADLDDNGNVLVDMNRDGLPDLLRGAPQESDYKIYPQQAAQSAISKSAVMTNLKDNRGLEMVMAYENIRIKGLGEMQYKSAYSPVLFQAVNTKRITIGQDAYLTRYFYTSGLWNSKEREFRGFETTKTVDADNNYTITKIAQDDIFKGRPLESASYDSAGKLFSKSVNIWDVAPLDHGSSFVFLKEENNYVFNTGATGKRVQTKYFYDLVPQLGNMNKMIQMGEVDLVTGADVGTDKRTIESEFLNNTQGENWIIGLPKHIVTKDNDGIIAREAWMYYDGSADNNAVPQKGFLTKRKDWAGSGPNDVNPETSYSYDVVGNLVSSLDANGNISSTVYDEAFRLFPLTIKNSKNHQVVNEYYGIAGVPLDDNNGLKGLWGQLKSTTDPNDQKGKRGYDLFGRTVLTVSPLDTVALPTSTSEIQISNQYSKVKVRQRVKPGESAMQEAVQFYDSVGRLLQTKVPSETAGICVVSGQSEYNSRGLPVKKYLPYFSQSSIETPDPIDASRPYATTYYDAMGRPVESWNADGTHSNVKYNGDSVESINENGHKQISYFDAFSRLIKKEEYKGADGRSPNYPATPFSLFATTLYSYDSEGNLKTVTDAQGNVTAINYDKLGRKASMTDADMGTWDYAYDPNGNLKNQVDSKNQQLDFLYDTLNRLMNKKQGSTINVDYAYDDTLVNFSKGRLTKAQDVTTGNTQFFYDQLGREIKSVKKIDGINYEVNRSYDDLNRLVSLQYPGEGELQYAYNSAGQIESVSGLFGPLSDPTPPAPSAPNLITAAAGNQSVALTWSAVSNAAGYKVKYGTASGNHGTTVDAGNVTNYQVNSLTNGTPYYFVVTAYNATGESIKSNEMTSTPVAPAPQAPALVSAIAGDAQVTLTWNAVTGASGYRVKFGTSSGNYPSTREAGSSTSMVVAGLSNGSPYYFVVTAYNGGGESGVSNEKTATPQSAPSGGYETIAFDNASSSSIAYNSTLNYNHTINSSGTNRMLVVGVQIKHTSATAASTSVTYGGQAMTLIDRNAQPCSNTCISELWYLANPPTGTNSVSIVFNASVRGAQSGAISLTGVRQGAPEVFAKAKGTSRTPSVNLTTLSDNAWIIDSLMEEISSITVTPSSGQVQRYLQLTTTGGYGTGSTRIKATPGAAAMSWTLSSSRSWSIVAAAFAPAVRVAGIETQESFKLAVFEGKSCEWRDERSNLFKKIASSRQQAGLAMTPGAKVVSKLRYAVFYIGKVIESVLGVSDAYAAVNFDLTTFTESNPSNQIAKTADCVSFNNIETTSTNAFVYKNNAMGGDYSFDLDTVLTSADSFAGPILIWGASNTANATFDDWSQGMFVALNKMGGIFRFELYDNGSLLQISSSVTLGQRYYLTVSRVGNLHTVKIYSNSSRTTQVASFSVSKTPVSYSYLYAFSTKSFNSLNGYKATGDVCRLADNNVSAPTSPSAPVLNAPTAGNQFVDLTWSAVSGVSGYKIKYGIASGSYPTVIDVGNVTSYRVNNLTNGTVYYFVLTATNASGESVNSNERSISPQAPANPPAAPTLNSAQAGDAKVTLSWSAVSNATSYKLKYGTVSGNYSSIQNVGNVTGFEVTGLTNATQYFFSVTALNVDGESPNSNEVSATPQSSAPVTFVRNVDYAVSGQIKKIEYGNGNVTTYTYHPYNFRLTQLKTVTANNTAIQDLNYTYDSAGNIISIVDNINTGSQTFQYDELGRLVSAVGNYGTKNYAYDKIGNIIQKDGVTYTYGEGTAGPHAVTSGSDGSSFAYDLNGNMTQMVKDAATWDYIYDPENRLTEVRKNSLVQAKFSYDGDGGRTKKISYQYSGGVASAFSEGTLIKLADGKEKPIETLKDGDWVLSFNSKTLSNEKIQVVDVLAKEEASGKFTLINDKLKLASTSVLYCEGRYQLAETLDSKDKLLDSNLSEISISSLKTISTHQKSKVYNLKLAKGAQSFYAEGILVQNRVDEFRGLVASDQWLVKNSKALGTSHQSLGTSHQSPDTLFDISHFKDYGDRVLDFLFQATPAEASTTTTTTRYVGNLFETSELQTTRHIYLGDMRIASITNNRLKYFHGDHLGGANLITDMNGTVKQLVEYEPFGLPSKNELYGSVDEETRHLFTGKELDDETGLYYYGARYYNPVIGRFLTADLLVQSADGNPQTLNRYSYAGNNPVNYIDPSGHWFFAAIAAFFKAASAFAAAHPIIAGAVTGGVLGGASAAISGGNIAQGIGLGVLGGMIGGSIGLGVGDYLKDGIGKFWSGLAGAGLGGAAAGAATAGVLGMDAGIGALSGFAGGMAGFMGSYKMAPSAGYVMGSVASAGVRGQDLGRAALGGFIDGSIASTLQLLLPGPTIGEQGTAEDGDLIFYKAGFADPVGLFLSLLQGSPMGHNAIAVGGGKQVDSHIKGGVDIRDIQFKRQGRLVKWSGSGDQKFVALATQYGKENAIKYWLGAGREVCSTFCGRVAVESGLSIPGFSPGSQYINIQGLKYSNTYGIQMQ